MDAPRPWYRHRWPWLLMLGPAIVVVAGIVTLWLAVRSDDGLVAEDYYKQGLAINASIERGARAASLGLAATVDIGEDGYLRVRLDSPSADPLAQPPSLRVVIAHPTRAGGDVRTLVVRTPDGSYAGRIPSLERGRWQLHVESDAWRLQSVPLDGAARGIRLSAPGP